MKRIRALLVLAAAAMVLSAIPAGASSGSRGYLIASQRPHTQQHVRQLTQAGANVKYVYRNFGGAAAVISEANLPKVRALSFVTVCQRGSGAAA